MSSKPAITIKIDLHGIITLDLSYECRTTSVFIFESDINEAIHDTGSIFQTQLCNCLKLQLRLHIVFEWMSGMSFYGFECFVYFLEKFHVQIKHTHQQFHSKVHLETASDGEFKKFIWCHVKTLYKKCFLRK